MCSSGAVMTTGLNLQTGCPDEGKDFFLKDLQEEIEKVEDNDKFIVNGDLNGHIGGGTNVISRIHGGNYFGECNEEGERVIDFAISNDLVVCNTIFKKRPEHLITYNSGNRASQIDFMLYRRCDRVEIQHCKVIPGDHVTAQHRLVTLDLAIMVTQKQIGKRQGLKRIKCFKLKYPEKEMEFKERVLNELEPQIIDAEDWWNRSSGVILRVAREVLGESTGKIIENKETWLFSEEVQQKTQLKKEAKKKHEQTRKEADKVAYKQLFDVLTEAVRENPPWCVLYADDVILLAKSKRALQRKLEHWREALESRGLRISRSKT
ncbi:hypothetical protein Pmani_016517 [Petrolisthes manimaculis]|uniref:Uncharacterized protein n=1 Tax=Petrolisthes manimaculis TaxID=1843537 RepID=A0AAE1PPJ1_9EUCA|nr:hypothetical protein Pmani_016517 [Petrolisthes manimaculis]